MFRKKDRPLVIMALVLFTVYDYYTQHFKMAYAMTAITILLAYAYWIKRNEK